jgi:hypothetical protein
MTALLALIPKPVLAAIIAALAVALLACGAFATWQTLELGEEQTDHANTKADFAQDARLQAENLAMTTAAYRKQEAYWQSITEEKRRVARKELEAAEVDGATAAAAGDRLRVRLSQLATCAAGSTEAPGAPARGASAPTAAGMLADVQRRLDAFTDTVARFADTAHIAGKTCEQQYDGTLTTTGAPP